MRAATSHRRATGDSRGQSSSVITVAIAAALATCPEGKP